MGIGCVLALWTVVCVLAAGTAAFGILLVCTRTGHLRVFGMILGVAGSIVTLGSALFVLAWIGSLLRGPTYSSSPAAFAEAFGFPPPRDVRDIHSQSRGSTDSAMQLLTFKCSRQSVARIAQRFRRASPDVCRNALRVSGAPAWWKPSEPFSECYEAEPFDSAFHSSRAWLSYRSETREVHFYYVCID